MNDHVSFRRCHHRALHRKIYSERDHRIFQDCVPCLQINIHHFEVCILWHLMADTEIRNNQVEVIAADYIDKRLYFIESCNFVEYSLMVLFRIFA